MSFICKKCGYEQKKWIGKCPECGDWNSMQEGTTTIEKIGSFVPQRQNRDLMLDAIEFEHFGADIEIETERESTGTEELDNVLGGGFVKGSAVLIGGEPGVGKSTLLLQILSKMATRGKKVFYVSGEESVSQISLRAKRLGITKGEETKENVMLVSSGSVLSVLQKIATEKVDFLFIDSIQTMFVADIESSPGTVSQIKFAAAELISFCKSKGIILIIVGHITKDGAIAGPKILEHMVDVVVYFESNNSGQFRLLRSIKNRFGATNEIGVFLMESDGLKQVKNPSSFFVSKNKGDIIFVSLEGTKPVLVAVESLIAKSYLPSPRRSVVGWDYNRISMILAIMQTRCGISFHEKDVYLNMAGGFKTIEPANDLAVIFSLMLGLKERQINHSVVVLGEVALSGDIRMVNGLENRIKEAKRLGYNTFVLPECKQAEDFAKKHPEAKIHQISTVKQADQIIEKLF